MPRIDGEIFEEYLKIQEQQGFITKADYASARRGSDNQKTIELLYGIKSEPEKILEKAHPETAVVSPAHDKMNGIVETLQQRQNIMAQIALKTPTGENTMHRYVTAHERLIKELYKSASLLDEKNETKLAQKADKCLEKTAIPLLGLIPWYIWTVAGSLGGLALLNRTDNLSIGAMQDSQIALDELADLTEITGAANITQYITHLHNKSMQFNNAKSVVINKANIAGGIQDHAEEQKIINEYLALLADAETRLPNFIRFIESAQGDDLYMENDSAAKIEYAARAVMSIKTDKEDAVAALKALLESVKKERQYAMSFIENAKQTFAPLVQQIAETNPQSIGGPDASGLSDLSQMFGGQTPANDPSIPVQKAASKKPLAAELNRI